MLFLVPIFEQYNFYLQFCCKTGSFKLQFFLWLWTKRNPVRFIIKRENCQFDHINLNSKRMIHWEKLYFLFLSNWMGYDRGNSFPFDFEPNGNPFGSKSKRNLSPRSYPIQFERKRKYSFLGAAVHFSRKLEKIPLHSRFRKHLYPSKVGPSGVNDPSFYDLWRKSW